MNKKQIKKLLSKNKPAVPPKLKMVKKGNGIYSFAASMDRQLRVGKYHSADPGDGGAIYVELKIKSYCELTAGAAPETRSLPNVNAHAVGAELITILRETAGGDVTISGSADGPMVLTDPGDLAVFVVSAVNDGKAWHTIFPGTGSGAGLVDADYGDITVSGGGTIMTIDNDVVTYAKMQNVSATDRVLGRQSPGAGDVEEIVFTAAARALADDATAADQRTTLGLGTAATLNVDTDSTLAANSDALIATQKATKTYVDTHVTSLFEFKGNTNASTNPNYPAALVGDAYVVSVAGRIGGASGPLVDIGDMYVARADNAGGTQAAVGASWFILEHNLVGALLAANNLSDVANTTTARSNLGAIGGNTGGNDNAIIRSDGGGGATVQDSGLFITDTNNLVMGDSYISNEGLDSGIRLTTSDSLEVLSQDGAGAIRILNPDGSDGGVHLNASGNGTSTADGNFFMGVAVGASRTTAIRNIGIGQGVFFQLGSGTDNVGLGSDALRNLLDGNNNTAIGVNALETSVSGSNNTAIGPNTLQTISSGDSNVAIGPNVMQSTVSGTTNLGIGPNALQMMYSGYDNVAIGYNAMQNSTGGGSFYGNLAIGGRAMRYMSGYNNLAIGLDSMSNTVNGVGNIFLGQGSGLDADGINNNVGIGTSVLRYATNNYDNVVVGSGSGVTITGNSNVVVGPGITVPDPSADNQLNIGGKVILDSAGVAPSGAYFQPAYNPKTYAAGTVYTLTTSAAAVDFGTTDPVIVLAQPGVYRVSGWAVLEFVGTTYAANQTATLKLRRTNNTAADLASGSVVVSLDTVTLKTATIAIVYWEAATYTTANANDSLTLFANVSAAPGAGSVRISQAFIEAERIA